MDGAAAGACPSDDELARWLDRQTKPDRADALERHFDDCATCRRLLAALVGPPAGKDADAERFGRYELRGVLGTGGMGVVHRAFDPVLGREVALKRVRGDRAGPADRQRLLHEARALAKLGHPAIVPVFDVGEADGELFFAMELVRGRTLDQRLREGALPWRQALALCIPAAEGLAAAHAAGIVHRDFKPANVMIADDGRVLVMDFGLARQGGGDRSLATASTSGRSDPSASGDAATRDGELVGTPLYMSPEQFLGLAADARSDQFAFCVVLFEALHGRHPWRASSMAELGARIVSGAVEPVRRGLPRWLDQAVRRGLSPEAADRHASMDALVAILRRGRDARGPWRLVTASAIAIAAAGAWLVFDDPSESCAVPDAAMDSIWSPSVRERITTSTAAAMPSGTLGTTVAADLDAYVERWHQLRRELCEQPDEVRLACLVRSRAAVSALVEGLDAADSTTLARALDAVDALPSLDRCTESTAGPLAPEPAIAARVTELRERAARASTLDELGKAADADALAQELLVDARALGFSPVLAEVLLLAANTAASASAPARARDLAEEAFTTAEACDHGQIQAEAAIEMVSQSLATSDFDRARLWLRHARATVDRGGLLATTPIDLTAIEAHVVAADGRPVDALERAQAAFDAYDGSLGPSHRKTVDALVQIARLQRELARFDDALATYDRVRERIDGRWGSDHPLAGTLANNVGAVLADAGRLDEATPYFERGLAIREATLGAKHLVVAGSVNNLANVLHAQGRDQAALPMYERAIAIWHEHLGPDHVVLAGGWRNVAVTLDALGRHDEALAARDRALEIATRHFADDDPRQAVDVCGRAETLARLGRIDEAMAAFARCVPVLEKLPAGHPEREHALAQAKALR